MSSLITRRDDIIYQLKQEGFTIIEIGAIFGMHKTSVGRIVQSKAKQRA